MSPWLLYRRFHYIRLDLDVSIPVSISYHSIFIFMLLLLWPAGWWGEGREMIRMYGFQFRSERMFICLFIYCIISTFISVVIVDVSTQTNVLMFQAYVCCCAAFMLNVIWYRVNPTERQNKKSDVLSTFCVIEPTFFSTFPLCSIVSSFLSKFHLMNFN